VTWINAFDPLDPVSGELVNFSKQPTSFCPHPSNIGYATSSILLYGHLKYLTLSGASAADAPPDLVTAFNRWITGRAGPPGRVGNRPSRQFAPDGKTRIWRYRAAVFSWYMLFVGLIFLGSFIVPTFVDIVSALLSKAWQHVGALLEPRPH
jgi:hypothetical protein